MSSLQLTEYTRRPAEPGTLGRPVQIRANFFEVTHLPDINIIHYDVTITPDVPPVVNRRVFEHLIRLYGDSELGRTKP
ncbi:eukaryotic translation initiation factor 2C, 2, partial [Haplosporangium sp. Z 27]